MPRIEDVIDPEDLTGYARQAMADLANAPALWPYERTPPTRRQRIANRALHPLRVARDRLGAAWDALRGRPEGWD